MPMPRSIVEERDACAIIANVDKRGRTSHANIVKTINSPFALSSGSMSNFIRGRSKFGHSSPRGSEFCLVMLRED